MTEYQNKTENAPSNQTENKMGTMHVNKLLIGISLPMMASMLVQALYNIVDSFFVSKLGQDALNAVSLAFPVQMLCVAFSAGMGVGVNAVLSKALGEKNQERVNKAATNGIFLAALTYLLFLIVGIFAVEPFFQIQTTNANIILYGKQYLSICCICSFGMSTQFIFERLLQSTGKTIYSMITQGLGAIINIILDPILIFGLFGVPKMGMAGAAVATVIGQSVAGVAAILFNLKVNHEIQISFRGFKPDGKMIGRIYSVGIPSIIMQSIGSIMNYSMNQILIHFSETATAVFGVYFKLQSFFFMPVFGLNNGLVPIIAYNFGAGKRSRMIKAAKLSVLYASALMLLGLLTFQFIPDLLLKCFGAKEEMLAIGVPALRIISIHFCVAGYNIIAGTVFQALGRGIYSMWVSITRQLLVLVPVAFLFSLTGKLELVWWSFPIAEAASFAISTFFLLRVYKNTIRFVPDNV